MGEIMEDDIFCDVTSCNREAEFEFDSHLASHGSQLCEPCKNAFVWGQRRSSQQKELTPISVTTD